MNYRCPICNGTGVVEPTFGGGVAGGITSKQCPGCGGTGMQWANEPVEHTTTIIKRQPCKKQHEYFKNDPLDFLPRS